MTERGGVFHPVTAMGLGDWVSGFVGLVFIIGWLSQILFK